MNELDVSGTLHTYAMLAANARDTEHLKEIIRRLKKEFNDAEIRKLKVI